MATPASGAAGRASPAEHNLPVPLTSLVGRARERREVGEALRRARLVTLTGPAGEHVPIAVELRTAVR